jgi:HSP20 family molecular chaperone IbpA
MAETTPTLEIEKEEAPAAEGIERTRARRQYVPRADIYETDDNIIVVADMPGVDESTIDVTVEKNVLSINGYPEIERPDGHNLTYAEYETGDYVRNFTLSDQIDQEHIEAVVRDGVLRLTLPKAAPAKAKKIEVKAA